MTLIKLCCKERKMFCSNCGKEIDNDTITCSNCNTEIQTSATPNKPKGKNKLLIGITFTILVIIAIITFFGIIAGNGGIVALMNPPNCESSVVKDIVINIFKENDYWYKHIDPKSIHGVFVDYPATTSYDKEIKRYTCTGTVRVTSNVDGFLPSEWEYENQYLKKMGGEHYWMRYFVPNSGQVVRWELISGKSYLKEEYRNIETHYHYRCPIEYTTQISEGQILVHSSTCEGHYNGKFE